MELVCRLSIAVSSVLLRLRLVKVFVVLFRLVAWSVVLELAKGGPVSIRQSPRRTIRSVGIVVDLVQVVVGRVGIALWVPGGINSSAIVSSNTDYAFVLIR